MLLGARRTSITRYLALPPNKASVGVKDACMQSKEPVAEHSHSERPPAVYHPAPVALTVPAPKWRTSIPGGIQGLLVFVWWYPGSHGPYLVAFRVS